ncbi:MAG TPA: LysR family transcriptional regulator [Acidimicrobiales bacterium]|jgi:DNA-binding transcriptional LysR family regulator
MPLVEPVPDLFSLDLLHSVAESGSIRQAAFLHGVSQPAASTRLRSLERTLGLQLLDRSHGRAQLTAEGRAVVGWSEEILEAMRRLTLGTQALRLEGATRLRVAASMTVAEYLIPRWLNALRASDPSISVSLQMGNSQHVVEMMMRDEADIGFVEGQRAPRELSSRMVCSDDLVVVVSPSSAWARRNSPIRASELAATRLVLRESGSGTREVLEAAMLARNLEVRALVELGSTTAIKIAVASGAGPSVLSRLAVETEVREGRLVVVPIEDLAIKRSIRVVWTKGRSLTASAKHLLRHVNASIS